MTQRFFKDSAELRRYIKDPDGRPTIVSFSRGKDCIGAVLALIEDGHDFELFHLDFPPPGTLHFIDESIDYYERFFGKKIIRYVHPSFYGMVHDFVHQGPDRIQRLVEAGVLDPRTMVAKHNGPMSMWTSSLEHEDIDELVRERWHDGWIVTGVRAVDSPVRWAAVLKHGPLNMTRRLAMAVYDWRVAELDRVITRHGIKLPVDYKLWGRTFDGIDYRFTKPLSTAFPDDFSRLREWFPLIETDFLRHEVIAP